MKNSINKKPYNYTEYQRRKDKSVGNHWTVPSSYRRLANSKMKAKSKATLHKFLRGEEVMFEVERRNILWNYW